MEKISYIGKNVKIGRNVKIWHFTYIGDNTVIGDQTTVGSLVHIDYNVKIGSNCKIQGMVYIPPYTEIGNNVFIGPGVVFTNDPYPPSKKLVGVVIEDDVVICAAAILKGGIKVGKNSVIGMGAIVLQDVPPRTVVFGVPAEIKYDIKRYVEKRRRWESDII